MVIALVFIIIIGVFTYVGSARLASEINSNVDSLSNKVDKEGVAYFEGSKHEIEYCANVVMKLIKKGMTIYAGNKNLEKTSQVIMSCDDRLTFSISNPKVNN